MPRHLESWTAAVEEAGGRFPASLFYQWAGTPPLHVVELLNQRLGLSLDPHEVVTRKDLLHDAEDRPPVLMKSVVAHAYEAAGHRPMAVVSGAKREVISATLDAVGIADLFDALVGSEDYARPKPDPEPFLTAATRLGVEPSTCLVFEDAEFGIQGAQAAGMSWVRVPSRA